MTLAEKPHKCGGGLNPRPNFTALTLAYCSTKWCNGGSPEEPGSFARVYGPSRWSTQSPDWRCRFKMQCKQNQTKMIKLTSINGCYRWNTFDVLKYFLQLCMGMMIATLGQSLVSS